MKTQAPTDTKKPLRELKSAERRMVAGGPEGGEGRGSGVGTGSNAS